MGQKDILEKRFENKIENWAELARPSFLLNQHAKALICGHTPSIESTKGIF